MEIWKASKGFVVGSCAGMMATTCIQPVDMVKVRIQLGAAEGGSTSPIEITKNMLKDEGVGAFYKGLTAGLTRQIVYTGARLGLYDEFTARIKSPEEKSLPFWKTAVCSLSAGGIAAAFGNPADLALIRMQADTMLPLDQRRGYTNVFSALGGIVKESGVTGLFKGTLPTSTRAMALNFGMLGFNTQAKGWLEQAGVKKGSPTQIFGASAIAGFFASFFSLPFDYVKTQVQKMKADPVTGEYPYKGPVDCAMKQVAQGGPQKLWSGFPTYYVRIAPHAMITLICQDAIKKALAKNGM